MRRSLPPTFEVISNSSRLSLEELRSRTPRVNGNGSGAFSLAQDGSAVSAICCLIALIETGRMAYLVRDSNCPPDGIDLSGDRALYNGESFKSEFAQCLWLQTSGTSGKPKWVTHNIDNLLKGITKGGDSNTTWMLSFDPFSFAGVQVILSALIGGHKLVCPPIAASVENVVTLAARHSVTHISGTPTFWRSFIRARKVNEIEFRQITLGGEIVDQGTLDALKLSFPTARIRHIYATTEVGVVMKVRDGLAGFPADWLSRPFPNGISLNVSDEQTLLVNVARGDSENRIEDLVDTRDLVSISGQRAYFVGRADSVINVGGNKVYPEEIEAHILKLPSISDVLVRSQPNPITGSILIADIVPSLGYDPSLAKTQIVEHLKLLPRFARPAIIRIEDNVSKSIGGKKSRRNNH